MTPGDPKAQERARELQRQIDDGRDPRERESRGTAADVAQRRSGRGSQALTVADVWPRYMAEGKPSAKRVEAALCRRPKQGRVAGWRAEEARAGHDEARPPCGLDAAASRVD